MDTVGEVLLPRALAGGIDALFVGIACGLVWVTGVAVRFAVDGELAVLGAGPGPTGGVTLAGAVVWALTWVAVLGVAGGYLVAGYALAGQSLGQRLVDLVVVTETGEPLDAGAATLRAGVRLAPIPVVAVLALLLGFTGAFVGVAVVGAWLLVDLVAVLADGAGRSLGDRLAGTVVAREALAAR